MTINESWLFLIFILHFLLFFCLVILLRWGSYSFTKSCLKLTMYPAELLAVSLPHRPHVLWLQPCTINTPRLPIPLVTMLYVGNHPITHEHCTLVWGILSMTSEALFTRLTGENRGELSVLQAYSAFIGFSLHCSKIYIGLILYITVG